MKTHVDLELDGTTYRLVPSPAALLEIAEKVGDPMHMTIDMGLAARAPSTARVFGVLRVALQASGHALSDEDANALLFRKGVGHLYEPYGEFLGALVNGGTVPEPSPGNRQERRAGKATARRSSGRRSSPDSGA